MLAGKVACEQCGSVGVGEEGIVPNKCVIAWLLVYASFVHKLAWFELLSAFLWKHVGHLVA